MIEHADPGAHPAVHVALERHHHFLRREGVVEAHPLDRRRLVEGLVDHAVRADVVQQRIAVANLQRLTDADADHAWRVAALVLVEHHRLRRHREAEAAQSVLDVDEDVLQRLVLADDNFFLGALRSAVLGDALRIAGDGDHFRAGTSPSNFTVAVTIPAVAESTDGPAAGGGAAGVGLPPQASANASSPTDAASPKERMNPLCLLAERLRFAGAVIELEVRKARVPLSSRGQDARFSVWTPGFESP